MQSLVLAVLMTTSAFVPVPNRRPLPMPVVPITPFDIMMKETQ